jgi:addiction module HigA family antidote
MFDRRRRKRRVDYAKRTSQLAIKLHPSFAVHPSEWLRLEAVEPAGLNVTELAHHLDVSRQAISKLLNGRQGLSAEMAIRFEKAFGLQAETLMRMQAAHKLAEARAHEDEIVVEAVAA